MTSENFQVRLFAFWIKILVPTKSKDMQDIVTLFGILYKRIYYRAKARKAVSPQFTAKEANASSCSGLNRPHRTTKRKTSMPAE